MATCEYLLGYRAALRHLIEAVDAPGNQLKILYCEALILNEFLINPEYIKWLGKWRKKWLKIAEQFKEDK